MTRYSALGKQVLRDGVHYADVCDPDEAARVAALLNTATVVTLTATPFDKREPSLRLIQPISGDEDGAIMLGNDRVGYMQPDGNVYGIGKDSHASWVAHVQSDNDALYRLKLWRRTHA